MDLDSKKNISHQIATGMAYLHGKDMVNGRLSSANIILDYRVKICLLEHGIPQLKHEQDNYGYLGKGQLTYQSPELIRKLYVELPHVQLEAPVTKQSDVYAFGTILYELFAEQFPFQGLNSHKLIWRIGSDQLSQQVEDVSKLDCDANIKDIINECWSFDADKRPSFSEIASKSNSNKQSEAKDGDDDNNNIKTDEYHLSNSVSTYYPPSTPSKTNARTIDWNKQKQLLLQFDNICFRKKQKKFSSKNLFSNKESTF